MKEIDGYWASWFAGFTDGEGCFIIGRDNRGSPGAKYRCRFKIDLRDDDKVILDEIHETLGMGVVRDKLACLNDGRNRRRQARFDINAINECAELVKVFDKYPLRAKKQRDFEIWKEAVAELQRPIDYRDPDMLEYYFEMIKEIRWYDEQEELVKPITVNLQLTFDFHETR